MAIDSAEKRKSISSVHGPYAAPGVTPNATKDQEWRQEAAYGYPGISVGGGPAFVSAWTEGSNNLL